MASVQPVPNKKNPRGWQVKAPRLTQDGKFSFYCPKSRDYDKNDAKEIEVLLTKCENDLKRRGEIEQARVDEIATRWPELRDKLIEIEVLSAAPFLTFGELIELFLESKASQVKPQSLAQTRARLEYVRRFKKNKKSLEVYPITGITRDDARAFDLHLSSLIESGKMKRTTRNAVISMTKALFEWALENLDSEELTRNPFKCIKGGSTISEKEPVTMAEEHAARILKAISELDGSKPNRNPLEWRVWFLLGYRQGLRVGSEAPELKREFIDFGDAEQRGTIRIKSVKTSHFGKPTQWRTMPLFDDTADALQELFDWQKANGIHTSYVFSEWWRKGNTKARGERARRGFESILNKAGVKQERAPQVLRQTAVNHIIGEAEYGEANEAIWLGHSRDTSRRAYRDTNHIPSNILKKKPLWESVEE